MKRLNCNNVLHRETAWCWKPGLCFWRMRWSFVRRTSRRQLRPGTLPAAPFAKERIQVLFMSCSVKHNCVFRTSKESVADGVSLSSTDAQRLFNAVKELLQIPLDEQDLQTADGDGYCLALNSWNTHLSVGEVTHITHFFYKPCSSNMFAVFIKVHGDIHVHVLCTHPVMHEGHALTHSLIHSFGINSMPPTRS